MFVAIALKESGHRLEERNQTGSSGWKNRNYLAISAKIDQPNLTTK